MTEYIVDTNGQNGHWLITGEYITRCRDCKHSTEEGITEECYFCHLSRWNTNPIEASPVDPDGFCAWAVPNTLHDCS